MKYLVLQALCKTIVENENNATMGNYSAILQGCKRTDSLSEPVVVSIADVDKDNEVEANAGAVMYIVVVLVFYSAGIMIMIIKYLRTETREVDDERILDDFFRTMPACKKEREQDNVNRHAIHAFHALTSNNGSTCATNDTDKPLGFYGDIIEEPSDGRHAGFYGDIIEESRDDKTVNFYGNSSEETDNCQPSVQSSSNSDKP